MTDNLLDKTDDHPEIDPNKDYYAELVGDGRKFKDNKALAAAKMQSDQYVEILERRLDATMEDVKKFREESTSRARLEDLMAQLEQKLTSTKEPTGKEDEQAQSFDPTKFESLVLTKIKEDKEATKMADNFKQVKDKLIERYGTDYKRVVDKQINELGITETELNDMARRQPKVLMRTLGLDQEPQQQHTAPPRSTQTGSFQPKGAEKRTWAYYQNLKKANPQAWYDPKTAVQMQKDAIELGDTFKDGDYYAYGGQ